MDDDVLDSDFEEVCCHRAAAAHEFAIVSLLFPTGALQQTSNCLTQHRKPSLPRNTAATNLTLSLRLHVLVQ